MNYYLQQILQRTGKLFESGSDLESHPHANQEAVTQLMGKVKHLMGDFDRRLSFRKKKLNDSVRLHQLTEAVSGVSLSLSLSIYQIRVVYKRAIAVQNSKVASMPYRHQCALSIVIPFTWYNITSSYCNLFTAQYCLAGHTTSVHQGYTVSFALSSCYTKVAKLS